MTLGTLSPIDQAGAALSAAVLRHRVIAGNIANRDAEGYRRLAVRFEQAWGSPAGRAGDAATARVVHEPRGVEASLERDLASMASNTLAYQVLARSLGAYFSLLGSALGGRT
jgi:flagellar basal body rod protein FlgB